MLSFACADVGVLDCKCRVDAPSKAELLAKVADHAGRCTASSSTRR